MWYKLCSPGYEQWVVIAAVYYFITVPNQAMSQLRKVSEGCPNHYPISTKLSRLPSIIVYNSNIGQTYALSIRFQKLPCFLFLSFCCVAITAACCKDDSYTRYKGPWFAVVAAVFAVSRYLRYRGQISSRLTRVPAAVTRLWYSTGAGFLYRMQYL